LHFPVAFSTTRFARNSLTLLTILVALCILDSWRTRPATAFLLMSWFAGLMLHNGLFHVWATALTGERSPGLITGTLVYLPLSYLMIGSALREHRLSLPQVAASLIIGGAVHYVFLATQLAGWPA
jgi:hypothetical protein